MTEKKPLTGQQLRTLLPQVKEIVLSAGSFLAKTAISSISQKEGHSNFVTDMDIAVQDRLVAALKPLLPDASYLLEESENTAVPADPVWIIDPIDGTRNFICGNGMSTISVGLASQGRAVLGVVYNPFTRELFSAARGQGAFLNDMPIHVIERPLEDAVLCAGTSPYYEELNEQVIRTLARLFPLCGDFRRFGSAALEICYSACGKCDGFFEYRLNPWDYTGAAVIMEEAGGKITTIGSDRLDCTQKCGILACGGNIFDNIMEVLTTT